MKTFLAVLLCAAAAANAAALGFSGFASSWKQDCTDGCAPPAGAATEAAAFQLDVPMNPGEARVARFEKDFAFPTGERISAAFTVYYVCPRGAAPAPGVDSCPSRYVQVQAALSGDARAFCAVSLNPADAQPFPVMMCAGENLRRPGERLGISLSREDVRSASTP
ncbi:MAG TPA: hypothetical protein VH309_00440 [Elusimicrobiota bacterium]|nr:hypothetical protein [Elusimicrobiota bacterium]